jgi:hypothetical protein
MTRTRGGCTLSFNSCPAHAKGKVTTRAMCSAAHPTARLRLESYIWLAPSRPLTVSHRVAKCLESAALVRLRRGVAWGRAPRVSACFTRERGWTAGETYWRGGLRAEV